MYNMQSLSQLLPENVNSIWERELVARHHSTKKNNSNGNCKNNSKTGSKSTSKCDDSNNDNSWICADNDIVTVRMLEIGYPDINEDEDTTQQSTNACPNDNRKGIPSDAAIIDLT